MTERSLAEWLSYLEQLHPSAIDMGLERSRVVLQRLGLSTLAPRVITVTGTNGKGSTCAFVAALLQAQGLKVGVYSSPHLLRYNERVQIAGAEVSDALLCEAFAAVEAARAEVSLTYFEMGTLAAFWLFNQAGLDALVLEVGLGGRLDAVNSAGCRYRSWSPVSASTMPTGWAIAASRLPSKRPASSVRASPLCVVILSRHSPCLIRWRCSTRRSSCVAVTMT